MGERSNEELLRIIGDIVGIDPSIFSDLGDRVGSEREVDASEDLHQTVLLLRLTRAFRALSDAPSRLRAVHYVEGLAARQPRMPDCR